MASPFASRRPVRSTAGENFSNMVSNMQELKDKRLEKEAKAAQAKVDIEEKRKETARLELREDQRYVDELLQEAYAIPGKPNKAYIKLAIGIINRSSALKESLGMADKLIKDISIDDKGEIVIKEMGGSFYIVDPDTKTAELIKSDDPRQAVLLKEANLKLEISEMAAKGKDVTKKIEEYDALMQKKGMAPLGERKVAYATNRVINSKIPMELEDAFDEFDKMEIVAKTANKREKADKAEASRLAGLAEIGVTPTGDGEGNMSYMPQAEIDALKADSPLRGY